MITPHVARHTFCSNMAKSGMNPKTLQKIMGHSDIGVTLNVYTHVDFEDVQEEMKKVCNRWVVKSCKVVKMDPFYNFFTTFEAEDMRFYTKLYRKNCKT